MARPQWISASDPYFNQFTYQGEFGEENPYISTIRGLQAPELWQSVARSLGYSGPFETQVISSDPGEGGGGLVNVPAPEFEQFIAQKKAEGYDFVTKGDQIDKDNQTVGLKTPTGEVVAQRPVKAAGFGEFFKEFVLPAAGIAFGMGGLNSLMGGGAAAAPANVLTGAGLGAMEGVGLSGNIINAATGQTIASLPASLTVADIGRGLGDVLGAASDATAGAEGVVEGANLAGQAAEAATSPYSLSSGTTSGTTGITPGVGGTTGITPVTTTPLGAAAGTAIDLAPALGATLGATASALPVGSSLGATTSALADAGSSASSLLNPTVVSGVANVIGGVTSANAAEEAAATQTAAATEAARIQAESAKEVARLLIEADKEAYNRQLAERKPLQDIGMGALRRIEAGLAPGGEFVRPFQMGDVLGSERYRTLLEAGRGAVEQSAFSRGMGMSTPAALNLTDLGQRLGVSEYDRTLAQLQAEREAVLRPLQSLSGLGITETRALGDIAAQSAANRGQAAAGAAGSIGTTGANALLSGAGSTAAGQIQAGNIMGQTISNVGNIALQMDYLNRLFGGPNVRLPMSSGGL